MTLSEKIDKLENLFIKMKDKLPNVEPHLKCGVWGYDMSDCEYYLDIIKQIKDDIINKN